MFLPPSSVVASSGHGLMAPSPERPADDVLDLRWMPPQPLPQQFAHFPIREHYAQQLSQQWGIPVKTTKRIETKSPEKPPLPGKNVPWQQRWKFYDKHRDDYPPHIRDMLDRIQNRNEEQAKQVELAIKEYYASQPREETSGGDWEKTNIAARTGVRPNLSAVSTTKDGAEVQIDDFDPARRVAIEYKASLDIPGKDPKVAERELQERMERHAQFAEDRGLTAYEWVAHSQDSYEKMTTALADLKGAAQKHPDANVRDKLLARPVQKNYHSERTDSGQVRY